MAHYVDGYVLPVPKKNVEAYRRLAQQANVMRDPNMDPEPMPFGVERALYARFMAIAEA